MMSNNGFPRRIRVDLMTSAERAVRDAVEAVEAVGAHPRLTDAVVLLSDVQNAVADGVEALGLTQPASASRTPAAPLSEEREVALAAIEKAHQMVSDLCARRREWIMSIPARPDHDPDLVIGEALRLARQALGSEPECQS